MFGDRMMRTLVLLSIAGFLLATLAMATVPTRAPLLAVALTVWGVAFGGAPTILQTVLSRRAGEAADIAQSLLVTGWNAAIAGGGLLGGVILQRSGATALAWAVIPMLAMCLTAAWPPRTWRT